MFPLTENWTVFVYFPMVLKLNHDTCLMSYYFTCLKTLWNVVILSYLRPIKDVYQDSERQIHEKPINYIYSVDLFLEKCSPVITQNVPRNRF